LRLGDGRLDARRRQAAPDRRQHRQHRSVQVDLAVTACRECLLQSISAREVAVEVIEGTVFGIDHDHVGYPLERQASAQLGEALAHAGGIAFDGY
jgi:hypothetical protein